MSRVVRTVRAIIFLLAARGSLSLYYRGDLLFRIVGPVVELAIAYVFFDLIHRGGVLDQFAPWPQVLWLLAIAHVVQSIFRSFFSGLTSLTEEIRRGTLDVILLWPVDPVLWISFRRADPVRLVNLLAALPLVLRAADMTPVTPAGILGGTLLLLLGLGIRFHLSLLSALLSLYLVRADALAFVVEELSSVSRYPAAAFRGVGRVILLYMFPVLLIANLPAQALTGELVSPAAVLWAGIFNLLAHLLSRFMWRRGAARYASAGG